MRESLSCLFESLWLGGGLFGAFLVFALLAVLDGRLKLVPVIGLTWFACVLAVAALNSLLLVSSRHPGAREKDTAG
ncbi:MAG: hypothetical protein K2W96_19280 [Gemmataceae bacterium]|nr:hypothetical protein [Gemmataceae bacterium]